MLYPKKTKNPNPSPIGNRFGFFLFGGRGWIRTTEAEKQQIYSLSPLATREHAQILFTSVAGRLVYFIRLRAICQLLFSDFCSFDKSINKCNKNLHDFLCIFAQHKQTARFSLLAVYQNCSVLPTCLLSPCPSGFQPALYIRLIRFVLCCQPCLPQTFSEHTACALIAQYPARVAIDPALRGRDFCCRNL